jgi:hypothetical protein
MLMIGLPRITAVHIRIEVAARNLLAAVGASR